MEVEFARKQIERLGARVLLMDAGILDGPAIEPDITREEVAKATGLSIEEVQKIPAEAEALAHMTEGAARIARRLADDDQIHGILGIGGGMGTALGCGVMRALPIGIAKFMVSSQAGNPDVVGPAVGTKDLCLYHSVTDVVGINRLTRTIFTKACGAIVGMANVEAEEETNDRKTVAFCAKGTTEKANRMIRERLCEVGYQPMTFHCFGFGPASMEEVIADGYIDGGVIEFASDWLDSIGGGASFPPPDRYENAGRLGLPQVFVPGSCDFIAAAPGAFEGRRSHGHNKAVALFRSTREELARAGKEIGEKLARSRGPVTVVIPMRGFCVHDYEGGAMYDPEANGGFVEEISAFEGRIRIRKIDAHINDLEFVDAVMEAFLENVSLATPSP